MKLFLTLLLACMGMIATCNAFAQYGGASYCNQQLPPSGSRVILVQSDYSAACAAAGGVVIYSYVIDGYQSTSNEIIVVPYTRVPIGSTLTVCAVEPVPDGWTVTATGLPGTCAGVPGGDMTIRHDVCESYDTNCYPPTPQIAVVNATPVVVPWGQMSTSLTINWSGGYTNPTCVWYQMDDFTHHSPYPPTCGGPSGSATFSVQPGHTYVYWTGVQSGDTTVYAKTPYVNVVQAAPPPPVISASPNPVMIPYAQTGMTTVSWSAPGVSGPLCVFESIDGAAPTNLLCGTNSGSTSVDRIQAGHNYTFNLGTGTPLASVTVQGVSDGTPSLRASSNPVIIPYGQASTDVTLNWNAPGYNKVSLYGSNNQYMSGQILCLGNLSGSGSTVQYASVGEIANLYLVPNQNCTAGAVVSAAPSPLLASLTLTGKQGAVPTLKASQNPVVIPTGQTAANFTLSWNAPGYTTVYLYGVQNLYQPGKIVCLGGVPSSGNATESMSTGEVATLYLSTQSCTAGNVVSAVPTPLLASLKLTAVAQ